MDKDWYPGCDIPPRYGDEATDLRHRDMPHMICGELINAHCVSHDGVIAYLQGIGYRPAQVGRTGSALERAT